MKPFYSVAWETPWTHGIEPVKARSRRAAKRKFRLKFPGRGVVCLWLSHSQLKTKFTHV